MRKILFLIFSFSPLAFGVSLKCELYGTAGYLRGYDKPSFVYISILDDDSTEGFQTSWLSYLVIKYHGSSSEDFRRYYDFKPRPKKPLRDLINKGNAKRLSKWIDGKNVFFYIVDIRTLYEHKHAIFEGMPKLSIGPISRYVAGGGSYSINRKTLEVENGDVIFHDNPELLRVAKGQCEIISLSIYNSAKAKFYEDYSNSLDEINNIFREKYKIRKNKLEEDKKNNKI